MEETRAIELLSKWDEIIDPTDCDDLLFWLSSWISEQEEQLTKAEGVVAQKRLSLIEEKSSVAKADAYLEVSDIYYFMRNVEKDLRRLKSARANVKRRYEILCNKILQTNGKYKSYSS